MNQVKTPILIVGAGPAGLAMAGRLTKAGKEFTIVESSDRVANTWHRHYDRLHLHTVNQWSHLPHLPFPDSYPVYVSRDDLIAYFEDYKSKFDIQPLYNQVIKEISKSESIWKVKSQDTIYITDHVILCTGINRIPNIPQWNGQDLFVGSIHHSCEYKNATPYLGNSVLIIGMGNTGAELAFDLSEHNIPTAIAVRSPISIVPRDLNGRPVQVTSKMLARLPLGIGDWLGSVIRKIYFGDLSKYGLQESKLHPVQQLRETGKTPVIDIGTVAAIKEGKITIYPNVKVFNTNSVEFMDGRTLEIDHVILATGYRPDLESFFPGIQDSLDKYNLPLSPIGSGKYKGAYFLGFDNYKIGGILGTIYTDTKTILQDLMYN